MTSTFSELMRRATALTRNGDLPAASALIREALGRGQSGPSTTASTTARVHPAMPARPAPTWRDTGFDFIDIEAKENTAATQARQREAETRPMAPPSDGVAKFLSGTHTAAGLRCDYKLYVPPTRGEGTQKSPLIVMLHGCTQTPDDFAAGTRMNELAGARGCHVLYPSQSQQMNPQRCWNWFKHNHQTRGRGEPALLESLTRHVIDTCSIDPSQVFVAGLSAGGAMAAILGNAYPETYAAVGVHSGLPAGAARDLPSALSAMKNGPATAGSISPARGVPTIVFHGDADATVHPLNAEAIITTVAAAAAVCESPLGASHDGKAVTRKLYLDAAGATLAELWLVHGGAHAWAGGDAAGSYTDPRGPDASGEMLRFFLAHPRA